MIGPMFGRNAFRAFVLTQFALLAALPLTAQSLPHGEPESVGMSSERLERVEEMLQGYVDRSQVAGAVSLVARGGQVVHISAAGVLDADRSDPMPTDAIFRIASMTKPVTSLAIMMLVEAGELALSDPLQRHLPEFSNLQVAVRDADAPDGVRMEAARGNITIRHLLTHRSGITYGFLDGGPVGNAYREAGVSDGVGGATISLAENIERLARQPLVFHPGTGWQYGKSTDVLGRVVEVVSGQPLDEFFRTRIFEPLGMHDTGFAVPVEKRDRLASVHQAQQGAVAVVEDPTNAAAGTPSLFSGGGGLYSTAEDYALFAQMLLNGGELNGVRLVSPITIDMMTTSHTRDINPGPIVGAGRGFGLGFAINEDRAATGSYSSAGAFDWYGIYGTTFWVDPQEDLFGIAMIQLSPNSAGSLREALRTAVYQAVTTSLAP